MYFTSTGWRVEDKDGKLLAEHKKTGGEDIHLHHTNLHNHLRIAEADTCACTRLRCRTRPLSQIRQTIGRVARHLRRNRAGQPKLVHLEIDLPIDCGSQRRFHLAAIDQGGKSS